MEALILIAIVGVLFFIFKSFNNYQNDNPYRGKNSDYSHPFIGGKKGDIYEEVLQSEFGLLAALTAKIAKADGNVCALEKELIGNTLDDLASYFSNPKKAREILQEIFDSEREDHDNIEKIAGEFFNYTKSDPEKRVKVIDFLINLSFIDKNFSNNEEKAIRKIAFHFHIPLKEVDAILEQFINYYKNYEPTHKDPYSILGVDHGVSADELKKVYRKLVKEHHPDIIKGKGLGEEYIEEATAKLQEINEAYEVIKKEKNF